MHNKTSALRHYSDSTCRLVAEHVSRGLEAQELFEAPTHEGAGWGDYAKMVELLEDFEEEEQVRMMHQGHARASDLVFLAPRNG
ncbi:hypothetical protein ACVIIV_003053 [Bradyrhizobium sp. USDA 4354]